jgi:hypothetical protein
MATSGKVPPTGRTSGRPRKCFPLAMYRRLLSQTSIYTNRLFLHMRIYIHTRLVHLGVCVRIESKAAHGANSVLHLPVQHFRGLPEVRVHESNLQIFSTAIQRPTHDHTRPAFPARLNSTKG